MFSQSGCLVLFLYVFLCFGGFPLVFLDVFPVKSAGSPGSGSNFVGKHEEMTSILEKEGRWHQALRPRQAGPAGPFGHDSMPFHFREIINSIDIFHP